MENQNASQAGDALRRLSGLDSTRRIRRPEALIRLAAIKDMLREIRGYEFFPGARR